MEAHYTLNGDALTEIDDIRNELHSVQPSETPEVKIDMGRIKILDSMALGQLVRLQISLRNKGINLQLDNLSPHAKQVIHHANLSALFGLPSHEPPTWDSTITSF